MGCGASTENSQQQNNNSRQKYVGKNKKGLLKGQEEEEEEYYGDSLYCPESDGSEAVQSPFLTSVRKNFIVAKAKLKHGIDGDATIPAEDPNEYILEPHELEQIAMFVDDSIQQHLINQLGPIIAELQHLEAAAAAASPTSGVDGNFSNALPNLLPQPQSVGSMNSSTESATIVPQQHTQGGVESQQQQSTATAAASSANLENSGNNINVHLNANSSDVDRNSTATSTSMTKTPSSQQASLMKPPQHPYHSGMKQRNSSNLNSHLNFDRFSNNSSRFGGTADSVSERSDACWSPLPGNDVPAEPRFDSVLDVPTLVRVLRNPNLMYQPIPLSWFDGKHKEQLNSVLGVSQNNSITSTVGASSSNTAGKSVVSTAGLSIDVGSQVTTSSTLDTPGSTPHHASMPLALTPNNIMNRVPSDGNVTTGSNSAAAGSPSVVLSMNSPNKSLENSGNNLLMSPPSAPLSRMSSSRLGGAFGVGANAPLDANGDLLPSTMRLSAKSLYTHTMQWGYIEANYRSRLRKMKKRMATSDRGAAAPILPATRSNLSATSAGSNSAQQQQRGGSGSNVTTPSAFSAGLTINSAISEQHQISSQTSDGTNGVFGTPTVQYLSAGASRVATHQEMLQAAVINFAGTPRSSMLMSPTNVGNSLATAGGGPSPLLPPIASPFLP